MKVWSNAVITDNGLNLLAKLTQGSSLKITRAVSGKGFVSPDLLGQQTEVSEPMQELKFLTAYYPKVGECALPVLLSNEGLVEGYKTTQIGVFANDPDNGEILYLILQTVSAEIGTIIPSEKEMPGYTAEWKLFFQYGQADNVVVTTDPANIVSRSEMEEYVKGACEPLIGDATGDGLDYTVTIDGITELKKGLEIIIIPDTTSSATIPTLNLNELGVKNIKQRLSVNTSLTAEAANESWMIAGKPVPLMFDGTQWVTITGRPSATALHGQTSIENGGTGADNAEAARVNLGITPENIGAATRIPPLTATLGTTWVGTEAPYTQVLTVEGIVEEDTPHIMPVYSDDIETALAQMEAWCMVGKGVSGAGVITFTCYEEVPSVEIPIQIEVIR